MLNGFQAKHPDGEKMGEVGSDSPSFIVKRIAMRQ
jgi:hypothetical protein